MLEDVKRMELGQLIDFIYDYNRKYEQEDKPKKRKANQSDWNAFWG